MYKADMPHKYGLGYTQNLPTTIPKAQRELLTSMNFNIPKSHRESILNIKEKLNAAVQSGELSRMAQTASKNFAEAKERAMIQSSFDASINPEGSTMTASSKKMLIIAGSLAVAGTLLYLAHKKNNPSKAQKK